MIGLNKREEKKMSREDKKYEKFISTRGGNVFL